MQMPEIIYEDRHMVAVNKPARVPVASEDSGDLTLLSMVREWNKLRQEPGKKGYCVPIHFLDRPVSGVILFAISSKGASRLNQMFRDRLMHKTYLAVVQGTPGSSEGQLEHWLAKDHNENFSKVVSAKSEDAKKCVLNFSVLATGEGRSIVKVNPITGRSHQIRAQFAAIGCPLLGDTKYGAVSSWDGRVALHAATLKFAHPVGGIAMSLAAKLPAYWREVWSGQLPDVTDIS
jgi:23S rRNA pseudouridine1911/1915/1917 synthase